jgi:hypothetical protein
MDVPKGDRRRSVEAYRQIWEAHTFDLGEAFVGLGYLLKQGARLARAERPRPVRPGCRATGPQGAYSITLPVVYTSVAPG